MRAACSLLLGLAFLFPNRSANGGENEAELTSYQKAIRGLHNEQIRAGLPSEKLLDLCIPTSKRTLGRFTEYEFEWNPGYEGLTIISKNGVLKRATEWSCTYTSTHFDKLTADDEKAYQKLRKDNEDVPHERYIGRWGWERPRIRDWVREEAKPGGASQR